MRALVTLGQGVGHVIMATPTIAALQSLSFGVDVLVEAAYPDTGSLLEGWEVIRHVHSARPSGRYDAVVRTLWHRHAAPALGVLGPEFGPDDGDTDATHEVVANLTAARALGYVGEVPAAHCEYDAADALGLPAHYAVIAPGYGSWAHDFWERKTWPHWEAFAARFLAGCDLDLVVLGTCADRARWPDRADGPVRNLCGLTTLRRAAGVIAGAECVIAIDNGLAHIAAALAVPLFVLFGPTREACTRPWGTRVTVLAADLHCRPCQATTRWEACRDWQCMWQLDADQVWDAVRAEMRWG